MPAGKYIRTKSCREKSKIAMLNRNLRGVNNPMWMKRAEKSPIWKGGKRKDGDGYTRIYLGRNSYSLEHRHVIEREIGRKLRPEEEVHHINGRRDDNRIENLMLFSSKSEHQRYHKSKLIISNNCIKFIETDIRAIVRINIAWENTVEKVKKVLGSIFRPVFLDFPMGRTKYPLPDMSLEDAIQIANTNKQVKYFAISNAESPEFLSSLRKKINKNIIIVPKIESEVGVLNFVQICRACKTKLCMLDREDLFKKVDFDLDKIEFLIKELYQKANVDMVKILELQGIIFAEANEVL